MLLVHLFVCFLRVSLCHFSLLLGVRGWLRFVIVALPGFSIILFLQDTRQNNIQGNKDTNRKKHTTVFISFEIDMF